LAGQATDAGGVCCGRLWLSNRALAGYFAINLSVTSQRSMLLYGLYLEGIEFLPEFLNIIFHGFDVNFISVRVERTLRISASTLATRSSTDICTSNFRTAAAEIASK
jgi:hypothetical protein